MNSTYNSKKCFTVQFVCKQATAKNHETTGFDTNTATFLIRQLQQAY